MKRDYRLLKEHKHNGEKLPPGTVLPMGEQLGDWLVEQHIAEAVAPRSTLIHGPQVVPPRQQPALLKPPPKRWCCG